MNELEKKSYSYTFDLSDENAYGVWMIIFMILVIILLIAIVWRLQTVSDELKKKILIPIQNSIEEVKNRFESTGVRAREIGDRLQGWEEFVRNSLDQETVETAKLALNNLAFTMMDTEVSKKSKSHPHKNCYA